jgi:hypothetical protein
MTTATDDGHDWVDRLKDVCDSTLRRVVYLTAEAREVLYVRDDIDPVSTHRFDQSDQPLPLNTSGTHGDEQPVEYGELLCVSRRFEDAIELHFPISATRAVAVYLDGTAFTQMDDPVPHLRSIIATSE